MLYEKQIFYDLRTFLILVLILVMIGIIFVYSSSSIYALEMFHDPLFFVKKQIMGIGVGLFALACGTILPLSTIKKYTGIILAASLLLVALTVVTGYHRTMHGASRWLTLPWCTFQPSELLKITLIIYVARFLEIKNKQNTHLSSAYKLQFCSALLLLTAILLKQPDFGMTVTLLLTTIILFFIAHASLVHIGMTMVTFIGVCLYLITFRAYRIQRVLTFLNPWNDPQGAGFQIIQSLIAIGSGHWFGTGIAHSKQKFFYLPMQHTDFIFSIIAEETGLCGSLFIIFLYILLLYYGMRIAHNLKNSFYQLTMLGFTLIIVLQACINIAVATGMVPTKGIGLPLISYGNTALVCYFFMIGVIINMVYDNKKYT